MFGADHKEEGLADVLEPQDLSFAPTVHIRDLSEDDTNPPASNPVFVRTPADGTQCITPFAYPLPDAIGDLSMSTKARVLHARVRHGIRGAFEELGELWAQTANVPGGFLGRVRALWSFWQWDRSDVVNAGVIALVVFTVVAVIGTLGVVLPDAQPSAGVTASEVRAPRTVDQHTGRVFLAITKFQKR